MILLLSEEAAVWLVKQDLALCDMFVMLGRTIISEEIMIPVYSRNPSVDCSRIVR